MVQVFLKSHMIESANLWILVQRSNGLAIIGESLDRICLSLTLVQRSNGPAIYEDSLDIICEFLILVQRSNGRAIYEESFDRI